MSRIKEHNYANNFCEIDGQPCIRCQKCKHFPKQSNNRFRNFLIIFLIILIIAFILIPLCQIGMQKHDGLMQGTTKNSTTLEDKVDNYNAQMSADERSFREAHGLPSTDSYGEHYNPMS